MITVTDSTPISVDSPESRSYNRVKRWLGVADFGLGLLLLVVLLATGWSGTLRDLALQAHVGSLELRGALLNSNFQLVTGLLE